MAPYSSSFTAEKINEQPSLYELWHLFVVNYHVLLDHLPLYSQHKEITKNTSLLGYRCGELLTYVIGFWI